MHLSNTFGWSVMVLRSVAISVFLCYPLFCLFFDFRLLLPALIQSSNAAMVVLMLIPDTFSDRMTSVVSGLCILGISLMFIFLNFLFPNEGKRIILLKLYPLFAVLPVLYCFLCRMSSMLKSVSYLAMSISGWEMFLYTINVVYAIISTGSILFAAIAVSEYTIGHKWLAIVSVLLSCSLLAVLIVRSITGGPIIK